MRFVLVCVFVVLAVGGSARAEDSVPTLVDWLKAHGQDPGYAAREKLFTARFPDEVYSGSAPQNLALWRALKDEAAAGKFPPARTPSGDAMPADSSGGVPAGRRAGGEAAVREFRYTDAWRVRVDPSAQTIRVDAPEPVRYEFPGAARGVTEEAPIVATLPVTSGFVSAAMLVQKAKAFDDGVYAAVEVAAQEGAGAFGGKRAMLAALRERLSRVAAAEVGPATAAPFSAARAAGQDVSIPGSLRELVESQIHVFNASPDASKPIGFYTWSDALRAIFRQDRILQAPLPSGPHRDALLKAIHGDPKIRATYAAYAALVERLTNPFTGPDLRPALDALDRGAAAPVGPAAFIPACRSAETTMTNALLAAGANPAGLDIMSEFVKAIRAGRVSLAVRPDSGWYDRTQWALEPFLLPEKTAERQRLELSPLYRARLEELFRGALALARETHVKSLELSVGSAAPRPRSIVHVNPELSVEPLATAWLRRADTYRYVRGLLETTFGRSGLATMRRRTPEGPVATPLDLELRTIEALFTGAFVRACREIGHPVGALPGADPAEAHFVSWANEVAKDPDLGRDLRMMVPVMVDPARGKVKVWVFLGWTTQTLTFGFSARPAVTVTSTSDGHAATADEVEVQFGESTATAAYPVFAEVWTSSILNRDEFRRVCDAKKTKAAILAAIER